MNIVSRALRLFGIMACTGLFIFSSAHVSGAEADVDALTKNMQHRYEKISTFHAGFIQNMTNAASGEVQKREGTISYQKPNLLRWETNTPEKELLLIGKRVVWDVFYDEGVAYKYTSQEILDSKTMLKFLTGQANLEEDFYIEPNPTTEGDDVRLTLIPKQAEPGLIRAEAWINPKTMLLSRIVLEDFYGNINDLSLFDLKENQNFPSDYFTYTPKKDIEVFDNTK